MSTDTTTEEALRRRAEEGQRAAEALRARTEARLAERTAALAAEQEAWDADLARRGPDLDADLAEQRRQALRDLQAAVDATDLERALEAWRQEASARFAQRALRDAWRQAHERTGTGRTPPEPSLRLDEADAHLGFLACLDRAATRSAQVDAEVLASRLVGERPTALPGEVLPGPEAALEHGPWCPDPARTEVAQAPVGRHSMGLVVRCTGCGAGTVLYQPPPEPEEEAARAKGAPPPDVRLPQHQRVGA